MKCSEIKFHVFVIVSFVLTCFLIGYPMAGSGWAEEKSPPTVEQLARGERGGWLPPSIEELTQGKVKIGDLITKDNVDLVKDYLTLSLYETIKKGMVLRMVKNLPPEKIVPRFYWEVSAANQGKAVMDQNGTVRLADGKDWPGGLPFPDPKKPLEAMANVKFGRVTDDDYLPSNNCLYVGKDGNIEKTAIMSVWQVQAFGRLQCPPLGTIPGFENLQMKNIGVFSEPLEMKGLGQLSIRYYDEYKNPDEGFVYVSALRRVLRVSATTYQDNIGGMDSTYGDPQGLREPYAYWDFKSITKKFMLAPEPKNPFTFVNEDGKYNSQLEFDHGHSFIRYGWTVTPMTIVEAVPKIKHIYGKKVIYMPTPPYWASTTPIEMVDIYDRQGKLWKCYVTMRQSINAKGGEFGGAEGGMIMYDLQTGHASTIPRSYKTNVGTPMEELSLTKLLKSGR